MMLEKNKIYKAQENIWTSIENYGWTRDYKIFSPQCDVVFNDGNFQYFKTHFIIGFDGKTYLNRYTAFDKNFCTLEEMTFQDYEEIRHVIDEYNKANNISIKCNRKKNCLVFNDGVKEGKGI